MQHLIQRFIGYATIDTQSDPGSETIPSTEKQWQLARKLAVELKEIGMAEVSLDDKAYVMASLPANTDKNIPTIGFISHMDTSPDFSGTGVKPRVIENYDGEDIILNEEMKIVLSPVYFHELKKYRGETLIVTDGTTLLGADDKAGITEIVSAMEYLINHPEIIHGKVRVAFTPDEEIGRGAHHFDLKKFGAEWAYTMDGSTLGELEYENFNAAKAKIKVMGKSVHPGYARNKMVNAIGILNEILASLPGKEVPEQTEGREGFFHVNKISGEIELAVAELIIRDHDRERFESRKRLLAGLIERVNERHGKYAAVEIEDQYFNMKEMVEPVFHIVEIAREAMESLGIKPMMKPIRGGTDGSQLSFMGLPCPNIFAGGHNFHGKYEYLPVGSMKKAVDVIVKICELTAKREW